MAQPYSQPADALNQALGLLVTEAGWAQPADVAARIQEADTETDARLAAMGYTLPFAAPNPPRLLQLSVAYARYAVLRDLYSGRVPSKAASEAMLTYKGQWEEMLANLEAGTTALVDSTGSVIARTRAEVGTAAKANPSGFTPGFIDEDDTTQPAVLSDDPEATE